MKQNRKKTEITHKDDAGLEIKENSANLPVSKSTSDTSGGANSPAHNSPERPEQEVTRTAEGRPGSYGIDDF
jgi:hypothetical protein